jgi:hypothetical protein
MRLKEKKTILKILQMIQVIETAIVPTHGWIEKISQSAIVRNCKHNSYLALFNPQSSYSGNHLSKMQFTINYVDINK